MICISARGLATELADEIEARFDRPVSRERQPPRTLILTLDQKVLVVIGHANNQVTICYYLAQPAWGAAGSSEYVIAAQQLCREAWAAIVARHISLVEHPDSQIDSSDRRRIGVAG